MAHQDVDLTANDVEEAVSAWQAADEHVRTLLRALARQPVETEEDWQALLTAREVRKQAQDRIGGALAAWLAVGGTVELVEPADDPEEALDAEAVAPQVAAPAVAPEPVSSLPTALVDPAQPTVDEAGSPLAGEAALATPGAADQGGRNAPPAPQPKRGPPASQAALQTLALRGIGGGRADADPSRLLATARRHLEALLEMVKRPLGPKDVRRVEHWVETVHTVDPLPGSDLVPAVAALVARMRALQQNTSPDLFGTAFTHLTRWSGTRRPGVIHGLARDHTPESGSWQSDAEGYLRQLAGTDERARTSAAATPTPEEALGAFDALDLDTLPAVDLRKAVLQLLDAGVSTSDPRLLKRVGHRYNDLKGDKRLAPVRKAWKAFGTEARPDAAAAAAPPDDWPHWHLTRGKTAVIVGGDPRPANRDRIRHAFQFARVEWPEHDAGLLDRLAARIQSGNLEVVLFNRYGGHIMDDKLMPVLRDDLSRWVRIEHGYGVEGVRQAMEAQWAHIAAPEDVARDAP